MASGWRAENPKDRVLNVRMDEETLQMLDDLVMLGRSKSAVIRKLIRDAHKELDQKGGEKESKD